MIEKGENVLVFRSGACLFAIAVSVVKEVGFWQKITKIPSSFEFLLGLIEIRGGILPLFDFPLFLQFANPCTSLFYEKKQDTLLDFKQKWEDVLHKKMLVTYYREHVSGFLVDAIIGLKEIVSVERKENGIWLQIEQEGGMSGENMQKRQQIVYSALNETMDPGKSRDMNLQVRSFVVQHESVFFLEMEDLMKKALKRLRQSPRDCDFENEVSSHV